MNFAKDQGEEPCISQDLAIKLSYYLNTLNVYVKE
jgi:hypothetical protein